MAGMQPPTQPSARVTVNAGRLWAGGAATEVVAAPIAIAGILLGRGLFDVDVLAPRARASGATPTPAGTPSERRWPLLATAGDADVYAQVQAERALLAQLHGGCRVPVGAYAESLPNRQLRLFGQVTSLEPRRRAAGER